jgi:hypothetical protein
MPIRYNSGLNSLIVLIDAEGLYRVIPILVLPSEKSSLGETSSLP